MNNSKPQIKKKKKCKNLPIASGSCRRSEAMSEQKKKKDTLKALVERSLMPCVFSEADEMQIRLFCVRSYLNMLFNGTQHI